MTWSPLGIVRTPSKLIIHGRLVLDDRPTAERRIPKRIARIVR